MNTRRVSHARGTRLLVAGFAGTFLALSATSATARDLPDFSELIERHAPVVVNITTFEAAKDSQKSERAQPDNLPEDMPDFFRRFFEQMPNQPRSPRPRSGTGSGLIYSEDGYIVTNHHVVDGADKVIVKLSDRREFTAERVGSDPRSDLALLKIDASGLPTARLGNSEQLKVGQWVLAIGSPFGFEHSATVGIVSAKGRSLPSENYIPFIQTDVAINPGNSGGPLFDLDGNVVGINAQIYTRTGGFMGLSFAIPIDIVSEVIAQIRAEGRVARGWLGVYIQEITRDLAQSFGMDHPMGALVSSITEDSPAADSDLEVGDIIVEFEGREVESSNTLPPMVGQTQPGKEVTLKVLRGGEYKNIKVTLGELPDSEQGMAAPGSDDEDSDALDDLGMTLGELTAEERKRFEDGGVRVREVTGDPARSAGILRGDVIQMFAGKKIENLEGFRAAVKDMEIDRPQPVLVLRSQGPRWLALPPTPESSDE